MRWARKLATPTNVKYKQLNKAPPILKSFNSGLLRGSGAHGESFLTRPCLRECSLSRKYKTFRFPVSKIGSVVPELCMFCFMLDAGSHLAFLSLTIKIGFSCTRKSRRAVMIVKVTTSVDFVPPLIPLLGLTSCCFFRRRPHRPQT